MSFAPSQIGDIQIMGEIGSGAHATVYLGQRGNEQVAVKLLRDRGARELDAAVRFRREGTALARLDHPGVVKVLEVGEADGHAYLVMEHASGQDLGSQIAARGPMSEDQVFALATQLARALCEVHRHGLIHRDIKPSNVIGDVKTGVKLIDFGLVEARSDPDGRAEEVAGTLLYAAPEQTGTARRVIDARADLYALGGTLFHCAAGRPPFESQDGGQLLQMHAAIRPPRLSEAAGTGPLLSAIVDKLLAKDPSDRYQSALGLLDDLERRSELEIEARSGTLRLGQRDFHRADVEVPLVGRSDELSSLEEAAARMSAGRGALVLVEGASGTGKSRLARELVDRLRGPRTLVLSAKCSASETTPFGPLRDAVDGYIQRALRRESGSKEALDALRQAAGAWGGLLKRMSPGMRRVLCDVPDLAALDPASEQVRFYDALADLLSKLATGDQRVVLLIDDVQWLDNTTPEVLTRLGERAHKMPLLVVMTARNQGRDGEAVAALAERLGAGLQTRIQLGPLSESDSAELMNRHLGNWPVASEIVARVVGLSAGNPFALGQYVHSLVESGALRLVAGGWQPDPERLARLSLSEDVVQLLVERIGTLRPESVRLARIGALIGSEFSPAVAAAVALLPEDEGGLAVDDLVRSNLVEHASTRSEVRFVHDRIREAVIAGLSDEEQRDLHQRIAAALERSAEDSARHVFALARHYSRGHAEQNPQRVLETSTAAGLRALDTYANQEAYDWLRSALGIAVKLGVDGQRLASLREAYGVAAIRTGRMTEAYAQLEEASRAAEAPIDRARVHFHILLAHMSEGNSEAGLEWLLQGLAELGEPYPADPAAEGAAVGAAMGMLAQLEQSGEGYGSADPAERDKRRLCSAFHFVGSNLMMFLGRQLSVALMIVRDRINTHYLGACREASRAHAWYGLLMGFMARAEEAQRHADLAVTMAEQLGDPAALAYARLIGAMAWEASGDAVAGEQRARAAEAEIERYLGAMDQAQWLSETSFQYQLRGYPRELVNFLLQRLDRVRATGNLLMSSNIYASLYSQLLLLGRSREALEIEREWRTILDQIPANNKWAHSSKALQRIVVAHDRKDLGEDVEVSIREFLGWGVEDFWTFVTFVYIGYVRLEQCAAARPEAREAKLAALDEAIGQLAARVSAPVHTCHLAALRAARARLSGRLDEADALLKQAEALALQADSRWGLFQIEQEAARIARERGDRAMVVAHAQRAQRIGLEQGYKLRVQQVSEEFGVRFSAEPASSTWGGYYGSQAAQGQRSSRRAAALLEVSLASGSSLDPREQARAALDAIVREIGAERGFLLWLEEERLVLQAGRSAEGADLPELNAYSSSVVETALSSRQGVVVTGSDEGQLLGSESAVAHNLRSIMAAPLRLRGKVVGVVYVDSRLLRGLFAEEDLDFLTAVGSHLAIAIETARMAKKETERVAMEKDLALTAAMQGMFLPESTSIREPGLFEIAGLYRPMAQCSGDFWWYDRTRTDPLLIVGDVTGHGAGAAMITVFAMTFFRLLRDRGESGTPFGQVLSDLDRSMFELARKKTFISLVGVEFVPERKIVRFTSASALPVLILQGEAVQVVTFPPSASVGTGEAQWSVVEREVAAGSRLLLFTDGLPEMPVSQGRQLGLKAVHRLFAKTGGMPLDEARSHIVRGADQQRGALAQQDDLSFFLVDILW